MDPTPPDPMATPRPVTVNRRGRQASAPRCCAAALGLSPAGTVWAHSPIEGLSSFYGGVLHPMLVPAHLVVLLALGLLLGSQAERAAKPAVGLFLLGLVLGLAWLVAREGVSAAPVLMAAAAVLGVLVAVRLQLPGLLLALVALAVGLSLSLDSDPGVADSSERWLALAGTGLGAALVTAAGLFIAEIGSRRAWQGIAVRVLGSWIAASAVMVSALAMLGPAPQNLADTPPTATPGTPAVAWPALPGNTP